MTQYDCAFIKQENVDTETDMHTQEKCHVNIKSELGVMHLQVKECQSLPADPQNREEKYEADSSSQTSEGIKPCQHLELDFFYLPEL